MEARLAVELGVTRWLAVGAIAPLRVFGTSIRYLDASGQPVDIENPFVHHHDETLVGPGDPWLLGRVATRAGGFIVGARLGVALPVGRTEPDPFALGDMGLPHEHSQFGAGTFEPLLGLDVSRAIGVARVDAFALAIESLYDNGHGYRAGDRYAAGFGTASSFGSRSWRVRATFEAQHETAETWGGIVHTDEGNTGRTDLMFGAEVTRRLGEDWHVGASIKLPVYTRVEGGQLDASAFVGVSVGMQLHVFDDDDDHAHHHHAPLRPSDWTGLDMRAISDDGAAVPLVPVPGKITVFDFWATWCEPCQHLDHELAEIARRHPDDLAVRKLDVVDVDSPASRAYVGAATLPHVKVYGRDGALLWERSAPPLVLAGDVAKLLEKPRAAVVGARRIAIEVTDAGYVPAHVAIAHGEPVTLVFTRTSETTCATDVHFTLPDGTRIDETLPLRKPVEIPLRVERPGTITYACGMAMNHGTIEVR